MKIFIVLLFLAIAVMMLGLPLWGLIVGPGFDP